jgi:hypothetical protein
MTDTTRLSLGDLDATDTRRSWAMRHGDPFAPVHWAWHLIDEKQERERAQEEQPAVPAKPRRKHIIPRLEP